VVEQEEIGDEDGGEEKCERVDGAVQWRFVATEGVPEKRGDIDTHNMEIVEV